MAASGVLMLSAGQASAQNAAFQGGFVSVCSGNPTGLLASRCAQILAGGSGAGDLAGDSESSLAPGQTLAASESSLGSAQALFEETLARLEEIRDEEAGVPTRDDDTSVTMDMGRLGVAFQVSAEFSDKDRADVATERGSETEAFAFSAIADYRMSDDWTVGATVGFDRTYTEFDADLSAVAFNPQGNEGDATQYGLNTNLFTTYNVTDSLYVEANLGLGLTVHDLQRNAIFLDAARTQGQVALNAKALTWGYQGSAGFGTGYDVHFKGLTFGPYARTGAFYTEIASYTEDDVDATGLGLEVGEQVTYSWTTTVGIRAAYAASFDWGVLVPQARFEYEHEFLRDPQGVDTQFEFDANNTVITVEPQDPDRDYATVGAGVLAVLPNGIMPYMDYEQLLNYSDFDRWRLTGGVRLEF